MTTDLRNALEEIAAMTYDAWTNGARAGEIARAALAAAPSTSPAAAPSVEAVEDEVGMGHAAWDTISPESIVAAVCKLASPATAEVAGEPVPTENGRRVEIEQIARMIVRAAAECRAGTITFQERDERVAKLVDALAAPHPSPSAAGRLAPVGWQERQATRGGWSAWYDVDKAPSVAFMAARDNYQWRRVFASTSPAIAHVIALGSPDDLITVANVTLEDSGPTLTLHFDQLGDMGSILGEEEATYTVRIAPMRRGDFDDLGEFDGF